MPHVRETNPVVACPSCEREVHGKYCSHCGEELSSRPRDLRLGRFLREAYHELFDLDSKLLQTLKHLFIRPGFLTLEYLAGRRNRYLRPLRLYILLVFIHFLLFSASESGDIFHVDRLPIIRFAPILQAAIHEGQELSQKPSAEFRTELSGKIKDHLSIVLYLAVFVAAAFLQIFYRFPKKYYVEHLSFMLHVMSFAMARNVLVIPLIMVGLTPLAIIIVLATQFAYTFEALRKVYAESTTATVVKLAGLVSSLVLYFYVSLHAATLLALEQIRVS